MKVKLAILIVCLLSFVVCDDPFKSKFCPEDDSLVHPCSCGQFTSFPLPSLFCNSTELSTGRLQRILGNPEISDSFNHLQILNANLERLPAHFDAGKDFLAIMLGKCNVKEIDPKAFSESRETLETLIIRENPELHSFPFSALADYEKLGSLFLHDNGLQVLSGLVTSDSLHSLMLNRNQIREIEALPSQPKLRFLSISENELSEIPEGSFLLLPQIAEVDLSGNKLATVKKGALHFDSSDMISIVLKENGLEEIEEDAISGINPHTIIDLTNNKLEGLPENVFNPIIQRMWKNMGLIRLHGNPLKCSCDGFGWLGQDEEYLVHLPGASCQDGQTLKTFLETNCFLHKTEL